MRLAAIALAAVLVLSLPGSAGRAEANGFCDDEVIRDYTKVLKRLPRVPAPPLDDRLNFGPSRVFVGRANLGPLQLEGGERGYVISYSPYEVDPAPSGRLDWRVTSRLVKLDRRGKPLGKPQEIKKNVKRLWPNQGNYDGLEFIFDVPAKPALYRQEVVFENASGRRLGRFGENFRVLRPSLDVGFLLNGTAFRRGEVVRAWLVNRGATFLSFGLGEQIQFNGGTGWTHPPVAFPSGPVPAIGLGIGPGVRTTCWSTTIPSDAALGTYRFVKTVDYSSQAPFGRGIPLELSAEFTVTE
jgi:hypothetical protein